MAEERQKRILIREYDLICDLSDCDYCEEADWCNEKCTMTRQEAIERMAKAIYTGYYGKEISWEKEENKKVKQSYKQLAEAALNALLGDK